MAAAIRLADEHTAVTCHCIKGDSGQNTSRKNQDAKETGYEALTPCDGTGLLIPALQGHRQRTVRSVKPAWFT